MSWDKSGGYPVPGTDRASSIAWAVMDDLATQAMVHGAVREALVRLRTLVEQGEQVAANRVLPCWTVGLWGRWSNRAADDWFQAQIRLLCRYWFEQRRSFNLQSDGLLVPPVLGRFRMTLGLNPKIRNGPNLATHGWSWRAVIELPDLSSKLGFQVVSAELSALHHWFEPFEL